MEKKEHELGEAEVHGAMLATMGHRGGENGQCDPTVARLRAWMGQGGRGVLGGAIGRI
jgi:hypothetical protein